MEEIKPISTFQQRFEQFGYYVSTLKEAMERVKPQSVLCVGRQLCSQQPQPMIRPPYLHTLSDAMLSAPTVTVKTLFIPSPQNTCKKNACLLKEIWTSMRFMNSLPRIWLLLWFTDIISKMHLHFCKWKPWRCREWVRVLCPAPFTLTTLSKMHII